MTVDDMTGYVDVSFHTETVFFALACSAVNFLLSIWCVYVAFNITNTYASVGVIIVAYLLYLISFNCLEEIHD